MVTAAIKLALRLPLSGQPLGYSHWAGVGSNTITYVLAKTCIFSK